MECGNAHTQRAKIKRKKGLHSRTLTNQNYQFDNVMPTESEKNDEESPKAKY